MKKKILFLADYSPKIGSGHWHRCLALSASFPNDYEKRFAVCSMIAPVQKKYPVVCVPTKPRICRLLSEFKPDLVICDLNNPGKILPYVSRTQPWLAMEDWRKVPPARGMYVVNPNIFAQDLHRGENRGSRNRYLGGARFYPLKSAIRRFYRKSPFRHEVKKILITFGGSDPGRIAQTLLRILSRCRKEVSVTAVFGPMVKRGARSSMNRSQSLRVREVKAVSAEKMYRLIRDADLVLTAGGVTAYECAAIGTPFMIIAQNRAQGKTGRCFADKGFAVYFGQIMQLSENVIEKKLNDALEGKYPLKRLSVRAKRIVDGQGASRIYQWIASKTGLGGVSR